MNNHDKLILFVLALGVAEIGLQIYSVIAGPL